MASLALAKQHLRVDHDDEDSLINAYLSAAVAWVENYTSKKLTRAAVEEDYPQFGLYLPLRWGPEPDALTIEYIDSDDNAGSITDARIVRNRAYPAISWPGIAYNTPIIASYTAGYATIPGDLDSAILLLVGEFYENREAGEARPLVVQAVENICRPYRAQLV